MDWHGRTVWITGASSGVGEALARECAGRGAAVILSARREAELERVAAGLSGESLILPFDTTDHDALPAVVTRAIEWRGGVDLLVNNAGISQRSLALDTEFEVYRRLIDVDFLAPVALTQRILPHMVGRRSGQIAIVSSVAGKIGTPLRTGYCAAKHACVGYFEALRSEVELAYGVGVSVILPGPVRTDIAVNALAADGSRRGRTDDSIAGGFDAEVAARMIADGLAAHEHDIVVAQGRELTALKARSANSEALFAVLAREGLLLAEARETGDRISPDPIALDLPGC